MPPKPCTTGTTHASSSTSSAAEALGRHGTPEEVEGELYGRRFLVARPLLAALETSPCVLLIDEIDRADDEFEALLLEVLSEFSVSIPEIGTITAAVPPVVVITSNRTRDVHDALKRRCFYHWVDNPSFDREVAIISRRLPEVSARVARKVALMTRRLREEHLLKPPGGGRGPRLGDGHDRARGDRRRRRDRGPHPRGRAQAPRGSPNGCASPRARPAPGDGRRGVRATVSGLPTPESGPGVTGVVELARRLRVVGVEATPAQVHTLLLALDALDPVGPADLYRAARLSLCASADDLARFDALVDDRLGGVDEGVEESIGPGRPALEAERPVRALTGPEPSGPTPVPAADADLPRFSPRGSRAMRPSAPPRSRNGWAAATWPSSPRPSSTRS